MKITLHNSTYFHQKVGGVSRYSSCLIKELINNNIEIDLIAPIYKNIYLRDITNLKKNGFYLRRYPNFRVIKIINDIFINFLKQKSKSNIIHDLYYPDKPKKFIKKSVLTIHDTIHEKYNEFYKSINFKDLRKSIIDKTDLFIAVSQNTKEDFIDYYKINENRVNVIGHGHEHLKNIETYDLSKISEIDKPFILYVGNRLRYKKFSLLGKAYSKSQIINNNFDIVCFGGEKISSNEYSTFKNLGIEKKIIMLDGNDSILKTLYKNCSLLVSTSNYEGFGINILEALSLNCKILSNDIKIFREIYKDSINYFENDNLDHLIHQLNQLIFNESKNDINIKKDIILENNNWKDTATKTIKLYKSLI